ncbi:hypothetical protein IJ843_05540 [bacterium]|nr:hypothetical protein [bacterium]
MADVGAVGSGCATTAMAAPSAPTTIAASSGYESESQSATIANYSQFDKYQLGSYQTGATFDTGRTV